MAGGWDGEVHSDSRSTHHIKKAQKGKKHLSCSETCEFGRAEAQGHLGRLLEGRVRKWSGAHVSLHPVDDKETLKSCKKGSALN